MKVRNVNNDACFELVRGAFSDLFISIFDIKLFCTLFSDMPIDIPSLHAKLDYVNSEPTQHSNDLNEGPEVSKTTEKEIRSQSPDLLTKKQSDPAAYLGLLVIKHGFSFEAVENILRLLKLDLDWNRVTADDVLQTDIAPEIKTIFFALYVKRSFQTNPVHIIRKFV
jgi:hypothetical protein